MKLAQLSTRYPPGPGGVERHVREITIRLGALGHHVRVLTSDLYREFPWERLDPRVPRRETTSFGRVERRRAWSLPGGLHYPFVPGISSALAEGDEEVVHVHTYGTYQVAAADRHRRRTGVPFVLSSHFHPITSMHGGRLRRRLRAFYDRRIGGPSLGHASALIVESHEEERLLASLGFPLPPVHVVPPGYTPLPTPPPPGTWAERFRLPGPFVLFVGRLAPNKGLLTLLEAFGSLAREDPQATLVLAGADGGMAATLDERTRTLGLEGRVRRLGHVEDDGLLAAGFRDARLFVLPSDYEAFGLVLLEAMAQGTPVIATTVGGIPEFVEDGKAGLLVPPADPVALSKALLHLWSDPAAARAMGRYGREELVPRYSWDTVVHRLEEVYLAAIEHGGRAVQPPESSSA